MQVKTTIKNGSKGSDVITLQNALNALGYGLVADGVFGAKTEAAIKDFQRKNKLTVDGIVSTQTWNALGVSGTNGKCIDASVIYKPLSVHVTKSANRKPLYLAIHYTAGSSSAAGKAQSVYNTFVSRSASADFAVDDRDIVQFNPDIANYYCWAVGDAKNKYSSGGSLYGKATNKNTISIEICSTCSPATATNVATANNSAWSFTDTALDNAVRLAKMIMRKYNIPIERVVRHYDISGKLCPGVIGWNNEIIYENGKATGKKSTSDKWLEFIKRLS